jgi:superfamily I DNA and/or RNA helicase
MAIIEEVERRIAAMPSIAPLLDEDADEGFFVKNLETVQGDERDVMIFSVGYGRDPKDRMFQNFGPLNRPGGERRLNVAITRARENIKLVTSMLPEDLVMLIRIMRDWITPLGIGISLVPLLLLVLALIRGKRGESHAA